AWLECCERGLLTLNVTENELVRRVAPVGVAPFLSLAAQTFHGVVEYLHQIGGVELAERLAERRHHVNLRLLHLDDRTAGVAELMEVLVECITYRPRALDRIFLVVVLHRIPHPFPPH